MGYTPDNNPYIPGDPYAYDLKWIVAKIKEYAHYKQDIDVLKIDVKALKDYIDNFIDNLDIQDAVNAKLDSMYDDGTLSALIADYISLNYYQRTITLCRVGRLLDRWGYDTTPQVLRSQSCCYANNSYYVTGSYNSDANQNISIWNATGALMNNAEFTQLGHANDICYLNGYLYIATGSKLAKVDAATLTFVEYINPATLNTVRNVATDGEKIYMSGLISTPLFGVESYDPNNGNIETLVTDLTFDAVVPQGSEIYNGYMYFLYNRAMTILRVNMTTWEKDFVYNVPDSDGYYYTGEAEDLLMVNGRMYLWTAVYIHSSQACSLGQLFDTDIINPLENSSYYSYIPYLNPQLITVNGNTATTFNPYDTFNTIEEACIIVPNLYIRLYNIDGGCYADHRGKNTSIIGINGSRTFNCISITNGYLNLESVGCRSVNLVGATLWARGVITLIFTTAQYSHISLNDNLAAFNGTVERSVIEFNSRTGAGQTIDLSGATGQTQTMVKFDVGKLTPANFSSYIVAAVRSAYGIWSNSALIPISGNLLISGNAYPFCINATLSQLNAGGSFTSGDVVITIASDGTVSATVNGSAVTPTYFTNIRFYISN